MITEPNLEQYWLKLEGTTATGSRPLMNMAIVRNQLELMKFFVLRRQSLNNRW